MFVLRSSRQQYPKLRFPGLERENPKQQLVEEHCPALQKIVLVRVNYVGLWPIEDLVNHEPREVVKLNATVKTEKNSFKIASAIQVE